MSVPAEVPPRRSQVVRRRSCPDKAGRTCNLRQTTSATRRSRTPTRGPGIERERRRNGQGAEGRSGGGFAAYRREGFTAATKRADKARRVTGAGRGKDRDASRRRRHPTTADPPRWTRPFRRDSRAAPRLGAKPARSSDSGLPESEVPRQNRCRAKHAPTGQDWCPSGWRCGQAPARLSRGVPSGRWPRTSWRQRRLFSPNPPRLAAKVGATQDGRA